MKIWLRNGVVLMQGSNVLLCDRCPCDVSTCSDCAGFAALYPSLWLHADTFAAPSRLDWNGTNWASAGGTDVSGCNQWTFYAECAAVDSTTIRLAVYGTSGGYINVPIVSGEIPCNNQFGGISGVFSFGPCASPWNVQLLDTP